MNTFYKVIFIGDAFSDSYFVRTFKICGLSDLWLGRQFMAPDKYDDDCTPKYAIQSPVPLIHFCDNALDTLLWRTVFGHVHYVFQINPLGAVQKNISDDNSLYQCGARGIELTKLITEDGLVQLARQELGHNLAAIRQCYTNPCVLAFIERLNRGER